MRVTTKGQVTIPKEIRTHLGIGPGSEVDFVISGDDVTLVPLDEARRLTGVRPLSGPGPTE